MTDQEKLNQLILQHGDDLPGWINYHQILEASGIDKSLITESMIHKAQRFAKKHRNSVLTWKEPVLQNEDYPIHVWDTECGRYRIARIVSEESRYLAIMMINAPGARESIIANDLRNLKQSLLSVEEHLSNLTEREVKMNAEEILGKSREMGLEKFHRNVEDVSEKVNNNKEECCDDNQSKGEIPSMSVKLSEKNVRKTLLAMGYEESTSWTSKWLAKKISKLDTFLQAKQDPTEDEDINTFRILVDALEKEKEVEIISDGVESATKNETEAQSIVEQVVEEDSKESEKISKKKGKERKKRVSRVKRVKQMKESKNGEGGMSMMDAAVQVLSKSKNPMSCKEIIEAAEEKGYWKSPAGKTPWASLSTGMRREIRDKKKDARFSFVGRGKFSIKN